MGQNLPLCAQLGAARSRQDESKEVGELGSKRTSSGCNGVHHVWWSGLIFRLLAGAAQPPRRGGSTMDVNCSELGGTFVTDVNWSDLRGTFVSSSSAFS